MQPIDRALARAWRGVADGRRIIIRTGSARSALAALGKPSRRDLERWNQQTAEFHERYRSAHPPVSRRVAVVCVSRRPHLVADVVENIARQRAGLDVDVVFVANHAGFASVDLERHFGPIGGARIVEPPPGTALGTALNLGVDTTSERFVAKLDDDDWYGPGYLLDGLRAHGYAGAGVVGKHSYYADLVGTGDRYLRFPGNDFRYSSTLAGGTLLIDRERAGGIRFADVSLGEDRAFLAACHRHGVSTFSADRFGFVQRRGVDNTWTIADEEFLARCLPVRADDPVHFVERPTPEVAA